MRKSSLVENNRRQSQKRQPRDWFPRHTDIIELKIAVPTRLCGVRAVRLGEGSGAGAAFAWVLLLARTPPPVVELLAIGLLAPPEHAHWPPCLFHHVHNAVQHLQDKEGHRIVLTGFAFSYLWSTYIQILSLPITCNIIWGHCVGRLLLLSTT